jgi:hypothetical protein
MDASVVDSSDLFIPSKMGFILISKDELEHKDEYFRVGIFVILHESEYMFDDRDVAEYKHRTIVIF